MNQRVVAAEWVADRLDEVAVVDVRDAWEYDGIGHIPTAVNIPFDEFRAEEHGEAEAGMLPGADAFVALAEAAGIDNDSDIVAYDDTHGVFAARFLVTAELYGHDPSKLHLLNGDYSSWNLEHEVSSEEPNLGPGTYDAAFDEDGPLVGIEFVRDTLDDPDAVIVDTREEWEYEEGHIPGAVRVDWRELVDDDTRGLRSESEMRELLEGRGVTPDKHVLLYCNTARRISHTYTVLRALGYEELAFYEGSLTEWEQEGGQLETVEN
ncbi:sulfurtransferase [Natronomonas halophila]|uniref:sulfurtransferase n=1 Tax=Natronomonas halophila TaxID=2747817 RepID=UPI0015B681A0|nr:rhodanese-like domain-containing protein [Natronomonas halophila]QLD84516.1 sulfurtransferase [Natronomonas halophila]